MGIQSIIGDISSKIGNNIQSAFDTALSSVSGMADRVGTFVGNIWDGGFAGLSNFTNLDSAIKKYVQGIQQIVDEYNETTDLDNTLKGEVATAMGEFVTATKTLLKAWAGAVTAWGSELNEYYKQYAAGAGNLSKSISADAQEVTKAAESVEIG